MLPPASDKIIRRVRRRTTRSRQGTIRNFISASGCSPIPHWSQRAIAAAYMLVAVFLRVMDKTMDEPLCHAQNALFPENTFLHILMFSFHSAVFAPQPFWCYTENIPNGESEVTPPHENLTRASCAEPDYH